MSEWTKALANSSWNLQGFVNVESGKINISAQSPFYLCARCEDTLEKLGLVKCKKCNRTESNSVTLPIGLGDGTYPVLDIWPEESDFSATVVLSNAKEFALPIHEPLASVLRGNADPDDEGFKLANLASKLFEDGLLVPVARLELDEADAYLINSQGSKLNQFVFADPRRDSDDLDGTDCRFITNPGSYVVLIVLNSDTDIRSGSRPDVLGVIITDIRNRLLLDSLDFPAVNLEMLLESSNDWVEMSRVSRGDIPAIKANWEIANKRSTLFSPDEVEKSMFVTLAEMYLFQVGVWLKRRPKTIANQFEASFFADMLEMAEEPAIPAKAMRIWFQ